MEVDKSLLVEDDQLQLLVDELLESPEEIPNDMLNAEPHPSDETLVLFAELVYTKKMFGETDKAYGIRILSGKLSGWRLLITVNNTAWFNGYFGAAFVHTGLQQVVVAHRGTDPKCFGTVYTDIKGIFGTNYTSCMNSATTFVDEIRHVINLANNRHRHYTLAITGHSLGAWLAQITTFSVKYLAIKRLESKHRLEKNPEVGIHAKTVGFDSPGARDMLDRILDDYYDRYAMNVFLEGLNITLYLSAPNHINTCGTHLGKIYRVFNDVSNLIYFDDGTIKYTFATHAIRNFVNVLIIDKNGKIGEVSDWAKSIKEYNELFKILRWDNNLHAHSIHGNQDYVKKVHRYNVAELESPANIDFLKSSFRVFSEVELQILYRMHILQEQNSELTVLNEFLKINKLTVESAKLIPDFDMDHYNRTITCKSGESLVELCKRLKQLMRWLKPQFTDVVEEQIKAFSQAADFIYYAEGQSYLDSLPMCWLDFADSFGFRDFLVSDKERVLCLVTHSGDGAFQMIRLRNILNQIERSNTSDTFNKYFSKHLYTFVGGLQLQKLHHNYGWPIEKGYMMVIDNTSSSISLENSTQLFNRVCLNSMKLVLIVSKQTDIPDSSKFIKTVHIDPIFHISDLTDDSQNKIFARDNVIIAGDKAFSFKEFLGDDRSVREIINQILRSECFKNFVTIKDYAINIKDTRPTLGDLDMPFIKLNIKTRKEFIVSCMNSPLNNILVVLSGLSRQELETETDWEQLKGLEIILAEGDAELSFREACKGNQDKSIYLFEVLGRDVYCKEIFSRKLYLPRKFHHSAHIDMRKFAEIKHVDDLFVVFSEEDKLSLLGLIDNLQKREKLSDSVLIAATKEREMNFIQKYVNKCIHFIKILHSEERHKLEWRYSHGSLKSLLPCMCTNSCEPIDETTLSKTEQNLIVITDEPGMGKTTSLASLSRLMDSPWIIYIELKRFQAHVDKLPDELTAQHVARFLLSDCRSQADGLLEHLLQSKINCKRVVIMLDGFDELDDYVKDNENAKERIVRLIIFLKNIPTVQIFLTARKYLKESLEAKLSHSSTAFVPISEEEQLKFLVLYWRSCLSLELGDYREEDERQLKMYAGEVLRQAKGVLGPDMDRFMGVPLQLRMLAEVLRPQTDILLQSPEVLYKQINIVCAPNLYKRFITLKYEIYLHDKTFLGAAADNLIKKLIFDNLTAMHGELGFRTFFPDFYDVNFDAIGDEWLNKLNRYGLVQSEGKGEFQFVHRTYAEYCCAQIVVHWLNQRDSLFRYPLIKEILVPQILLHPDSKIIRLFMNVQLNEIPPSKTALELNRKYISQLWFQDSATFRNREHETALHIAIQERNEHIVTFLLGAFNTQEAFVSFITQYNIRNNTALNIVDLPKLHSVSEDSLVLDRIMRNILQRIEISSEEAKERIFFASLFNQDISKSYVKNYLSSTSRIFNRVEEVELIIIPFKEAIHENKIKLAKEILFSKQLKNDIERYCFLLMKHEFNDEIQTVLHNAAQFGHLGIVKLLAEQTAVPFAVLMAQWDREEKTPLHRAAENGHQNIVNYLVERGADINTRCELGRSALMRATDHGQLLTVKYLVKSGAEMHSVDNDGKTVLHVAALQGYLPTVKYLVKSGANINATDNDGWTALYFAALGGHLPVVEYLLKQGADPDRIDRGGETALTVASDRKWDVVRLLLDEGADVNVDGGKALSEAIWAGEWSIVEAFIHKGAAVQERHILKNLSEFKDKFPHYEFKKE